MPFHPATVLPGLPECLIRILILIVIAGDNHILTAEMEGFREIFEWGDGVK